MMGIIGTVIIGFIAGLIARAIHPGDDKLGFFMTAILGVAGAAVAQLVGNLVGWYKAGDTAGFIASVVGAIVILMIYSRVKSSGGTKPGA
ncbi:MAG: GlsB/YeaQ/YmgE family stress response membrane protein [Burkholderiales bacterium]|nr:GlsB/YeaQ/YmgE family stress response membrane protein [Burkholderiales bacterium]